MIRAVLAALITSLAMPVMAGDFLLDQPIDCELGKTCYIQHFVDRDPESSGARDYRCGTLTYDGHKGTDFALPSLQDMQRGVDVVAAADGIVRQVRDGVPDSGVQNDPGRECGNGVVLGHQDRWETQYCHLRKGTVAVKPGQTVAAGTVLGQVGYSGSTEFPHLHFSVRRNGTVVDPFAPQASTDCDVAPQKSLWTTTPEHQPGGIISLAFLSEVPQFEAVRAGLADAAPVHRKSPSIVLVGYGFGGQKGDKLRLLLSGPKGAILEKTFELPRNHAQFFRAVGKKKGFWPWPGGDYAGHVELYRQGRLIDRKSLQSTLQ